MDPSTGATMTEAVPEHSNDQARPPDLAALPLTIDSADQGFSVLYPAACDLLGWSVRDAAGNSVLQILDGTEAANFTVGEGAPNDLRSDTQWMGPGGVRVSTQLAVLISGDLTGAVWIRPRPKGQ